MTLTEKIVEKFKAAPAVRFTFDPESGIAGKLRWLDVNVEFGSGSRSMPAPNELHVRCSEKAAVQTRLVATDLVRQGVRRYNGRLPVADLGPGSYTLILETTDGRGLASAWLHVFDSDETDLAEKLFPRQIYTDR